jgi:hypothetical protein
MALAAGTVKYPETSALILLIAFAISTVWIVLHLRIISKAKIATGDSKSDTQLRYTWIIINMLYIILLSLYNQEGDILVTVDGYHIDLSKWGFIALMIVVMILDHIFSEPPFAGFGVIDCRITANRDGHENSSTPVLSA